MGHLKDIIDSIDDLSKSASDISNDISDMYKSSASIAKRASDGVLQFPVLVSSSIDIDSAQMVAKALERNYATFAQIVFSMSPTLKYHDGVNATDYLKKFHQNNPNLFTLEIEVEENVTTLLNEATEYFKVKHDGFEILSAVYEGSTSKLVADNKEQMIDLLEHLRHDILNRKYTPKSDVIYNFKNKALNEHYNNIVMEAPRRPGHNSNNGGNTYNGRDFKKRIEQLKDRQHRDEQEKLRREFDAAEKEKDRAFRQAESEKDRQFRESEGKKTRNARYHENENNRKARRSEYGADLIVAKNMLTDNDVKKSNELIATTLHLMVKLVNDDGEYVGTMDFIVGIKAYMHLVKSTEMIKNMVSACTNNDKIFNFIRWTTGEISFFKDFLFNIKGIKNDISDLGNGASPWWTTLKHRRDLAKIGDRIFAKQGIMPNATIVMSAEEVEYIRTEYGYDLTSELFINKIMKEYFLLGFVIVDSSAQLVHFHFDGDRDVQTVSFSGLEKANVNSERTFREMLKTMNRM